ncbi:MAG: Adaptive-response sensory-kinase SasA [Chlorobi bacterium]|nr:Adaptive-response sensory-kinase SasA [Chlorobiota bacterium]
MQQNPTNEFTAEQLELTGSLITEQDPEALEQIRCRIIAMVQHSSSKWLQTNLSIKLGQHFLTHALYNESEFWYAQSWTYATGNEELRETVALAEAAALMNRRLPFRALEMLDNYLSTATSDSHNQNPELLVIRASLLDSTNQLLEANEAYLKAIEVCEAAGDTLMLFQTFHAYAHFCYQSDELQTARHYLEEICRLATEPNLDWLVCQAKAQLAEIYAKIGDADLARTTFNEARQLSYSIPPLLRGFVLTVGMEMNVVLRDFDAVQQLIIETEQYIAQYPSPNLEGNLKGFKAFVLAHHKDYRQAESYFTMAIAYNKENSYHNVAGMWQHQLGLMYLEAGLFQDAAVILDEARENLSTSFTFDTVANVVEGLATAMEGAQTPGWQMERVLGWMSEYYVRYTGFIKKHISHINLLRQHEQIRSEEEIFQLRHGEIKDANNRLTAAVNELTALAADKDEMLAIATRDLQHPLANLETILHTLADAIRTKPEFADQLDDVHVMMDVVRRMDNIVSTFLDFGRTLEQSQALVNDTVDISLLISETISRSTSLLQQKKLSVIQHVPKHCTVLGNATLFNAIADNLLSNAVKHSPNSGTITVSVVHTHPAGIQNKPHKPRGRQSRSGHDAVVLSITDQGTGIPPNEVVNLFTKYGRLSTTPTGGEPSTGLGLYLSQKMAARMKAVISYAPAEPHGAMFLLTMQPA